MQAIIWHDPLTWQNMSEIWWLPLGPAPGYLLMAGEIGGGMALFAPQTAPFGSALLMALYLLFTLVSAVALRETGLAYFGVAEQLCAFCGASAAFVAGRPAPERPGWAVRALHWGLGACALAFMLGHVLWFRHTAELVPRWIPFGGAFWAAATATAFACAGAGLFLNVLAVPALRLMAAMMGSFILLIWIPKLAGGPPSLENLTEFSFSCLMASAVAMVSCAPARRS